MMRMLRCCARGGIVAASLCGPTVLHAQTSDSLGHLGTLSHPVRVVVTPDYSVRSLGHPRTPPYRVQIAATPDSQVRRHSCGSGVSGGEVAYRIIGASGQLLFMSSADTGSTARVPEAAMTSSLGPSQIVNVEVLTGAAVEQAYGKSYVSGLVVITLDEKGTEAWLRAESARAWKR
jgi:hypothetical protein